MTYNQPSSKTASVARKVLAGENATPEETKALAAYVLGQDEQNYSSSETPSIAGKVLARGKATREEAEHLAATAVGEDQPRGQDAPGASRWWVYAAIAAAVAFAVLVIYARSYA
jgi:hypothetical protein